MNDNEIFTLGMALIKEGYVIARKGGKKSGTEVKITAKGKKAFESLKKLKKQLTRHNSNLESKSFVFYVNSNQKSIIKFYLTESKMKS